MSEEAMEIDPVKQKAEALQAFTAATNATATCTLPSSIAKLSGSSRGIPSEKDFHFYYNFDEFKVPIKKIAEKSGSVLEAVGSSVHLWGKGMVFPDDFDDGYDWLVNLNDEVLERFDVSLDEFRSLRKKEEETGVRLMSPVGDSENGFQFVYGKKKKGVHSGGGRDLGEHSSPVSGVKVVSGDKKTTGAAKPKVPFHIPTIPRPQDEYKILVNNSNQPFQHVWLQRSEDGSKFVHPLEKFSVMDFVDKNGGVVKPVKPPALEFTPFKLVEEVKDLKELAAKLRAVNEFAIDLEHNQYRSFQGLTCLMQISTRTEDFVVDTLKLRIHIGPYLRELFKDPEKKKVMHGADRDILWLQRDFGIYVCNLFDTGQASRILKLERNSLEYLLQHFCSVTANKEYQNAEWRLRPLPDKMLRYAREDTHYLLYIYDLMRLELISMPIEEESLESPLVEVYKRSYDICIQLYEKEILTDSSYLNIYGLQGADLNAQQLAIVSGLCEWRDVVARAEDESTGYILPNKTLLEIAKQMPVTANKLRRLLKSKHTYVERNLNAVVSIIRHSMQNAAAFEAVAERLKEARAEMACDGNVVVNDGSESLIAEAPMVSKTSTGEESTSDINTVNVGVFAEGTLDQLKEETVGEDSEQREVPFEHPGQRGNLKGESGGCATALQGGHFKMPRQIRKDDSIKNNAHLVTGATIQVLKKPSRAFGALLGNSATKRKFDTDKKEKEEMKLEQIKSSVNFPFHSFSGGDDQLQPVEKEEPQPFGSVPDKEAVEVLAPTSNSDDIILLEGDPIVEEAANGNSEAADNQAEHREENNLASNLELGEGDETMTLSDLSSSFQKCFQSLNQTRQPKIVQKFQKKKALLLVEPFDYEAARNQVRFGEDPGGGGESGSDNDKDGRTNLGRRDRKKGSGNEETGDFPQARRRQAFPASGNRSATFR